jgi:glycine/D-amino acid oxidase-like deaminating enzyme
LQNLKALLGRQQIDYQKNGSYELFLENESSEFEFCLSKLASINTLLAPIIGKNVFQEDHSKIKDFQFKKVAHIIKNNFEGQLDTGKMMHQLIRLANSLGVIILNGMEINSWEENPNRVDISINKKHFKTRKLIICTNGFGKKLLPEIDIKPARAQVLITAPIKNLKIKGTFHYQQGYYYFRNIHNRILLGGGRNLDFEGETTTEINTSTRIQEKLEEMLQEIILPHVDFKIEQRWAGIMGIGNKKTTIVKNISDRVSCAIRLGGMGVAIGSLIGKEVAEKNSGLNLV